MKLLRYKISLRKEPEGGYTATVPSLPGCVTYGATIEEAINMAKEAIELYIESLQAHGEEIPTEDGTLEYNNLR
ncbi:MAG: type II toxin-antitoxin system HicB family antitoxin [Caldisericum sp.]|uniref:type II toxin-antitoxin system HicB family antitoxin n=1 Tax=Caldisericum sp. TaxID=2499687 RepID=UPI003D115527